jgi:hypothetical protein
MRTTVTLDEKLVRDLMEVSGAKNKTAAVASAVKDQIRRAKLRKLSALLGTVDVNEAPVLEGNEEDLLRAQWLEEIGMKDDSR